MPTFAGISIVASSVVPMPFLSFRLEAINKMTNQRLGISMMTSVRGGISRKNASKTFPVKLSNNYFFQYSFIIYIDIFDMRS